jgi:sulfite reductase alpha subunit-like flavoprotein
MPDAVRRSFVTVASCIGNMGEEGGEEFVKSLEKSGRYLIDTWA